MPTYKMVDADQLDTDLTSVANAIRTKGGTTAELLFPANFCDAIDAIPTGDTSRAVIDNDTINVIEWTGYGNKQLTRALGYLDAKVIYMPGFEKLDAPYFFQFMQNLQAAIFPDVTSIANYVFWDTNQAHTKPTIDFYKAQTFPSAVPFRLAQGVNIILRSTTLSTTSFTKSTWGIPDDMHFYVPTSLLNDYKTGTNWDTFDSDQFVAIEGSAYEAVDWWKSLT